MPDGFLMPAPEEVALARTINERLPPHIRVTPMRRDAGDDMVQYGMVFEYFDQRKPVLREYPFFDPEEVIKLVMTWVEEEIPRYRELDNWVIAR